MVYVNSSKEKGMNMCLSLVCRQKTMRRLSQLIVSILFVICVLSIYLLFDYAVNHVIKQKHIHKTFTHRTIIPMVIPHEQRIQTKRTTRLPSKSAQQFHKSKTGIKMNHKKQMVISPRNKTLTKM